MNTIKNITNNEKFEQLIMLGDIHGTFGVVGHCVSKFSLKNSVIFQVGDFGLGYQEKKEMHELRYLNRKLSLRGCYLYAIRGNHDDPIYFNNEQIFSNIIFLDDWTILNLNIAGVKERIFCFGGAISIDRKRNQELGGGWWPDEVPKFDNTGLESQVKDITIIATHTSPKWSQPYFMSQIVFDFAKSDATLLQELENERYRMSLMFAPIYENNKETLKAHYYGHFHFSALDEYKGVKQKLLNVEEACLSL